MNKRVVHRALEIMGARTAMRAGSELMALAGHQESARAFMENAPAGVKKETRAAAQRESENAAAEAPQTPKK